MKIFVAESVTKKFLALCLFQWMLGKKVTLGSMLLRVYFKEQVTKIT